MHEKEESKVSAKKSKHKGHLKRVNAVEEIKFTSRRMKNFDDDASQDDEQSDYIQSEVPADLNYVNTQGDTVSNKPNPRFKNYSNVFKNLVKSTNVVTMYPIMSMIITYDSTKAITVTKKDDQNYYVK